MKYALLFKENTEPVLVSADDVKNGKYSRNDEFVDPEYEFKVQFVKGARNNGGPYFRLYYSYEEYKELYPGRASRYEIVANMRRYEESQWHKGWKEKFASFCNIEKCIKNPETKKWRFADAFYEKTKTCIEFQHSYIALDFEERNEFYSKLSINTVWLYDLPGANARIDEDGNVEILEDNARGFFRISETPDNLKKHKVYIQMKSGKIYRVRDLLRKDSSTNHKGTIRYFKPTEIYTEDEFIEAVKSDTMGLCPKTLHELWDTDYTFMIVKNIEQNVEIFINRDNKNEMYRNYNHGNCIEYKYVDSTYEHQSLEKKSTYYLPHKEEYRLIWIFICAKNKNGQFVY